MTPRQPVRTIQVQPNVDRSQGEPATQSYVRRGRYVGGKELARLEWRVGDAGDPARVVRDFLVNWSLPLPGRVSVEPASGSEAVAGAALFVSAAGGAAMVGGAIGAPSPTPDIPDVVAVVYAPGSAPAPVGDTGWRLGAWEPSWTPAQHAAAVEAVRASIARGDVYQVNVVGHASAPYRGDPGAALRRVVGLPGARYPHILTGAGWAVASASPETLVRVRGGAVETLPIKGTRPATAAGRQELLASPKERAEHVMIVDLERNDLAQVARVGTVEVPELFAVRRWADLWQAESRVTAQLADGVDLADLLRALCPGGSVTGAPKLAALDRIAALEPVGRGPSMGAIGWLDHEGLDLGLTIRTVAADGKRLHLWAGGGIVWDSDPYEEVAEAAQKAAPIRAALR
jgi:para-aminobenzoate synthetase component 1